MSMSVDLLARIAGRPVSGNMASVMVGLAAYGARAGLDRPHRLAHFLAQLGHESAGFRHDHEVWGPSAAQSRYDVREDLGNTPQRDGDGYLYRGRTPIQLTGRDNYRQFHAWARGAGLGPPDFVADPDLVLTDTWEGLAPIWFWESRSLGRWADENDAEMLTRRINGGLNGYRNRLDWYARAALVLLGFGPDEVARFQGGADLVVDGIAGPRTRAALHRRLVGLPALEFGEPSSRRRAPDRLRWLWDLASVLLALAQGLVIGREGA
ncbi:glycoside hydrolase family 19 protein [Rhodosalinus sp. K401]|uniref:glycoside hydrolase family 19 protein n=1 Tax=Rhodosalinus sp. K401 TaxID=3239195 RepID=UPI0035247465